MLFAFAWKIILQFPICEQTSIDSKTGKVQYRRLTEADRWVVEYVPFILLATKTHCNCKVADCKDPQYLFKYLHKGRDVAKLYVFQNSEKNVDETKLFLENIFHRTKHIGDFAGIRYTSWNHM